MNDIAENDILSLDLSDESDSLDSVTSATDDINILNLVNEWDNLNHDQKEERLSALLANDMIVSAAGKNYSTKQAIKVHNPDIVKEATINEIKNMIKVHPNGKSSRTNYSI
jgi:hypothetical protein